MNCSCPHLGNNCPFVDDSFDNFVSNPYGQIFDEEKNQKHDDNYVVLILFLNHETQLRQLIQNWISILVCDESMSHFKSLEMINV